MIVQRFTVQIKPGKWDEALALAIEGRRNVWPFFKSSKVYSANTGPLSTIVFESEFEDLAEVDKLWKQLGSTEKWGSWYTKWMEVSTGQGKNELWNLEDK